jgi:hypothetical protein
VPILSERTRYAAKRAIIDQGAQRTAAQNVEHKGMDNIKKKNKEGECKLFKWKGGPLGTIHDAFRVLGALKEIATLQDTLIGANYCMVAEKLEMPI